VTTLLRPVNPRRVVSDDKGFSNLPSWDVVAHLTRVFGFEGWDKEIVSIDLVDETLETYTRGSQEKQGWNITYRCLMRLTIRDPEHNVMKVVEEGACGSANHIPSKGEAHDFAYKNAISYALKRCAKDLGDQFGLSLYNQGSTDSTLSVTLGHPDAPPNPNVERVQQLRAVAKAQAEEKLFDE
jgi:recombination DNA repair RAD52 pathway protein